MDEAAIPPPSVQGSLGRYCRKGVEVIFNAADKIYYPNTGNIQFYADLHSQEIILDYSEKSSSEEDKNVIFMLRSLIKTGMRFDSPIL